MSIELTERQFAILNLKLQGKCDKEIAGMLNVSHSAIKHQTQLLCRKFNVTNGMVGLQNMMGHFEMKLEWVPNPKAPEIKVIKLRRGRMDNVHS
jgi:DNA-binding NarL/FixJ family response regulator